MLARTSGGAAAPKSKGKGTREGGASTPKRAGEETPPAAARAPWGRRGGRLPVRPCRNPKGRENFREGFFFFFFWHFPVIYVAAICGSLGDELPRQRQLRVRVSVRFFGHAAARLLTRLHLGSLPCAERGTGKEQGGLNTRTREKARPGQGRVGFGFGFGDGDAVRRRSAPRAGCPAGGVQSASGRWRRFLLTAAFLLCFIELLQRVQQFLWGEDVRGPY